MATKALLSEGLFLARWMAFQHCELLRELKPRQVLGSRLIALKMVLYPRTSKS